MYFVLEEQHFSFFINVHISTTKNNTAFALNETGIRIKHEILYTMPYIYIIVLKITLTSGSSLCYTT